MKKITRKILFYTFVLIFLIITPLICLYATGYKIGNGFKIQKTGIMVIETEPEGAKIYLDGKLQKKFFSKILSNDEYLTTPIKIKNILPEEYDVKIELKNYWPWEKKVSIESGKSIYLDNIILFKKNEPLLLDEGSVQDISFSPNKKHIFSTNNENSCLININNEKIENISREDINDEICLWSPKSQKIISDYNLIDLYNLDKPISLKELIGQNIKNIKWDINKENNIYYIQDNTIYLYDLSEKRSQALINNDSIIDYMARDNILYYLAVDNFEVILKIFDINSGNTLRHFRFPNANYEFIHQNQELLNIYDTDNKILYLFDPFLNFNPLIEQINNINKNSNWYDGNKLIFSSEFEISLLDLEKTSNRNQLITRISDPINSIIWHPDGNHIIFSTNNKINIIELDKDNKHTITEIASFKSVSDVNISKNGDALFFYADNGEDEGLFKLALE